VAEDLTAIAASSGGAAGRGAPAPEINSSAEFRTIKPREPY